MENHYTSYGKTIHKKLGQPHLYETKLHSTSRKQSNTRNQHIHNKYWGCKVQNAFTHKPRETHDNSGKFQHATQC